jgi:hypothetical protein
MAYLRCYPSTYHGENGKNHNKPQARELVPQRRLKLGISRIQLRSITAWADLLSNLAKCFLNHVVTELGFRSLTL